MTSSQLSSGEWRWFVMGCYFKLENASTVESIILSIVKRLQGNVLLVAGNFNANLAAPNKKP